MINDQSVDVFQMGDIVVASTFSTLKMEIDGIKFIITFREIKKLWTMISYKSFLI